MDSDEKRTEKFCWSTKSPRHGKDYAAYEVLKAKAMLDGAHVAEVFGHGPTGLTRKLYVNGTMVMELNAVHHCPPEPPEFCSGT